MAQKMTCAFFLIALIMFATAKPLVHGVLGNGGLLGGILGSGGLLGSVLGTGGLLGGILDPILSCLLGPILGVLQSGKPVPIANVPKPALNVLPLLVEGLNIDGHFCCAKNGKCPATGGQPLSGALVILNCTRNQLAGGSLVVGQNKTDLNGYFKISVKNILDIIPNIPPVVPCNITLHLDQAVCPIFDAVEGILGTVLTGVLKPVSFLLDSVLGLVLKLTLNLSL